MNLILYLSKKLMFEAKNIPVNQSKGSKKLSTFSIGEFVGLDPFQQPNN